jgi:uncharacterized protein YbjT (DUF2867 family)
MTDDPGRLRCLVTGATGYIGGRLVPELVDAGFDVRCMSRSPKRLRDYPWVSRVERVEADATDPDAVRPALDGVDVAYYLIHALGTGRRFEERDRQAARTFAAARGRAASAHSCSQLCSHRRLQCSPWTAQDCTR